MAGAMDAYIILIDSHDTPCLFDFVSRELLLAGFRNGPLLYGYTPLLLKKFVSTLS